MWSKGRVLWVTRIAPATCRASEMLFAAEILGPPQLLLIKVPLEGLEPPTLSLGRNCSSIELQRQRRKSSEHRMSPVVITLST